MELQSFAASIPDYQVMREKKCVGKTYTIQRIVHGHALHHFIRSLVAERRKLCGDFEWAEREGTTIMNDPSCGPCLRQAIER